MILLFELRTLIYLYFIAIKTRKRNEVGRTTVRRSPVDANNFKGNNLFVSRI